MKIGIDCRLWNQTGVGRYTRNLVINIAELGSKNDFVLFVRAEDRADVHAEVKKSNFKIVIVNIPWHGLDEQTQFPKILNSENLDLMHFPYFSVPFFYYKPYVVTVHDLIVNKFNTGRASTLPAPLYLAKRVGYHAVMANAVYRAKKIIVPSKTVKEDLLNTYLNVNSDKIIVTYEGGFESNLKLKTKNEKKVEGQYLLRVGNFYPHKNVEKLLTAFASFVYDSADKNIKLVLVGKKDYFYARIEKEIDKLHIGQNVEFFENVSDAELFGLYKNAAATIVPSFMEGFSLTTVEAMSTGSPVVVSDIPVHREICRDGAIYFNPEEVNDIKQKINFVFSLVPSSRKELIEEGEKQAKKFSWSKMARETLEIYENK